MVGLPAHPLLRSEAALAVVGPAAFGHPEVQYLPLAPYRPAQPVPHGITSSSSSSQASTP